MPILNIRTEGDPVLRTQANEVKEINDKIVSLLDNMKQTMQEETGVGLAAPQVGVSYRIIVIQQNQEEMIEVINPKIVDSQGKDIAEEGCLSIPGKKGLVARAEKVTVKGLNRQGEEVSYEADGLLARIFQHEIDHLDGVLFTDKLLAVSDEKENIGESKDKKI